MRLLTKLLQQPMKKMRLASSSSPAMAAKFAAYASYSTASSPVEESIWLMLPSHEAKDVPSKLHQWQDSCFYDVRSKSFVTSDLQNQKTANKEETPKILGSSHGFLALLNPSDCSLSLAKIPPRFESSPPRPHQVHDLPGLDTLPEFPYKIFRESEYSHKYGNFQVAGFAFKRGSKEEAVLSKEVADSFVNKIVMSDPRSGDCHVVMSLSWWGKTRLAFCQGFDAKRWNVLGTTTRALSDVIYSHRDNKLYGIRDWDMRHIGAQIEVWDLKNQTFPMEDILTPRFAKSGELLFRPYTESKVRHYLVASTSGEILLVTRHLAFHVAEDGTRLRCKMDPECELPYGTFDFAVFRLSPSGEKLQRVKDLGDEALFLGINQSFTVSAAKFPGIQGNSIYFTDYYADGSRTLCSMIDCDPIHSKDSIGEWWSAGWENYGYGGHDFGIFSMEDKCFSSCYPTQSKKRMQCPPVWVAPTSSSTEDYRFRSIPK